jgi:hypothetical protein
VAELKTETPVSLTELETIHYGSALQEISDSQGFKVLMTLLKVEREAAATRFIKDDKTSKKYARGYLAGLEFLLEEIPALIESARTLKDMNEEAGETFLGTRLGSGSLAG